MTLRAATDQTIGGAGVVIGSTVTVSGLTQAVGLVAAGLGLILTVLSIWLVLRRLRLTRLEIQREKRDHPD